MKIVSFSTPGLAANRVWNRVEDILQGPNKRAGLCTVNVARHTRGYTV